MLDINNNIIAAPAIDHRAIEYVESKKYTNNAYVNRKLPAHQLSKHILAENQKLHKNLSTETNCANLTFEKIENYYLDDDKISVAHYLNENG